MMLAYMPSPKPDLTLLRGGTIVTRDPAAPAQFDGDLLIRGSEIAEVAPAIVPPPGSRVVDVGGKIVSPGLIDTHRHTWQSLLRYLGADWTLSDYGPAAFGKYAPNYTPDDVYIAVLAGLAEALDAGITQLFDWNHNVPTKEHAEAAIQAHRDSGMRVVFGIGESPHAWRSTYGEPDEAGVEAYLGLVESLCKEQYRTEATLLTAAMAARGPEKSSIDTLRSQWDVARRLGIRLSVHVGNGPAGRTRPIAKLADAGLLGADVTYVHCNSLADDEIRLIVDSGGSASVAPVVESNMGHGPLAIARLLSFGLLPSLSVDTCVNAAGDLFGAMHTAVAVTRGEQHAEYLERGERTPRISLPVTQVLDMATVAGARANGLEAVSGALVAGRQADIVIYDTSRANLFPLDDAAAAIVMGAHPGNVESVFVAGRQLKRGGQVTHLDVAELKHRALESAARVTAA